MEENKNAPVTPPPPPPHVVLLASPGAGHLIPLSELARRLTVDHGFTATLLTFTNLSPPTHSSVLNSLPSTITTQSLPAVSLDDLPPNSAIETLLIVLVSRSRPNLRSFLLSLKASGTRIAAFVPDIFCAGTLQVAAELSIPHYLFNTSNFMVQSLIFRLPELHESTTCDYRDLPEPVRLPGCVPLRGIDIIDPIQDRTNPVYDYVIELCLHFRDADGYLVNSFEDMEAETFKALKEEEAKGTWPPAYPVGPLTRPGSDETDKTGCMNWLDRQPAGSVLYVSFGSAGTLSMEQTTDLALGLEMSGQRFLWVVHFPSDKEANALFFGGDSTTDVNDPLNYLPEGFLERTKDIGLAIASWAPQIRVLNHPATAGFLSHCGWNSTLESIVSGVPMIAWPLFAEQKMNAVMLVDGAGLALRLKGSEEGIVVQKEKIAEVVKELMEGEEKGKSVRRRAKELQKAAKKVLAPEGSSSKALEVVANKWKSSLGA